MTELVECPACEVQILVTGTPDTEYECPHCGCRFLYAVRGPDNGPQDHLAPLETSLPLPRRIVESRVRPKVDRATQPVAPNEPTIGTAQAESPEMVDVSPIHHSDIGGGKAHRIWILVGAFAFVLMLVVAVTAINRFSPQREVHSRDLATPKELPPLPVSPAVATARPSPARQETSGSTATSDDAWADLRFATREEYFSLWGSIHPYLVCLNVRTPGESRTVGGVIVDSRGYVATSFRGIQDAITIDVRLAAKSLIAGPSLGELSDQVRGLVAKDEAHDIAILEINRRFVSSFANVKFGDSAAVLPGDRSVVASPPAVTGEFWIMDFPIRHVLPFTRLMPNIQGAISTNHLAIEETSHWIIGEPSGGRNVPGSPVFNFAGELIALLSGATAKTQVVACPSHRVFELLKNVAPSATPFPIDPRVAAEVAAGESLSRQLPDPDSPAFELSRRLQQVARRVAQFKYVPTTAEQYKSLREFAETLLQIGEQTQFGGWSESQASAAQNFLVGVLDDFTTCLHQATVDQMPDFAAVNRWALDSSSHGESFAAFGEVIRTGLRPPDNEPYVIFHMIGGDQNVFSKVEHDGPVFLPGSQWLVLGRWLPKMTFRSDDGNSTIDARVSDIEFVISLSDSEKK